MRKTSLTCILALAGFGLLPTSQAHDFKVGPLEIHHPWARATAPGTAMGAVYFKVTNSSATADALLGVEARELAEKVELHQHVNANGVMSMRPVEKVAIPAQGSALLKPGGYHIMLINLKKPMQEGQKVPITLRFQKAGEVKVEIKVEALTVDADAMHHKH